MTHTFRSLALAVGGAVLLSACGALNAFIPDQEVPEGVLGIGSAGIEVELAAEPFAAGVGASQMTATVFTGTFDLGTVTVPANPDVPGFVRADAITEKVTLGDSIVVTYPTTGPATSFTLTGLAVRSAVEYNGNVYDVPFVNATGLSVVFDDATCADGVCTYGTATSVLPVLELEFAAALVAQYSILLKNGGQVDAEFTVTATLASPGLPADAEVVVTIESLGAVIEF